MHCDYSVASIEFVHSMVFIKAKNKILSTNIMRKIDDELLKILVCPLCKSELEYDQKNQELICNKSKLAYQIQDGIPIMLIEEARKFSDEK